VRRLAELLTGGRDCDDLILDYMVIVVLIVTTIIVAFICFGDAVADLVTLIGGRVDQATISR
jgi:hypothetical protein